LAALALTLALMAGFSVFAVSALAQDASTDPTLATTDPGTTTTDTGTGDTGTTTTPTDTGTTTTDGGTTTDGTGTTTDGTGTTTDGTGTTTTDGTGTEPAPVTTCPAPTTSTTPATTADPAATTDPTATTTAPVVADPSCPVAPIAPTEVQLVDPETGMLCADAECVQRASTKQLLAVEPIKLILCNDASGNADRPACRHNPSRGRDFFHEAVSDCKADPNGTACAKSLSSCQQLIRKGHFVGHPTDDLNHSQRHTLNGLIDNCHQFIDEVTRFKTLLAALQGRRAELAARLAALQGRAGVNRLGLTSCGALSSFGRLQNVPDDVILLKLRCPGDIAAVSVKYETASGGDGKVKAGQARVGQDKPLKGKVRKSGAIAFPKVEDTTGEDVGFRLMLDPNPATGATFHIRVKPGGGEPAEKIDLTI
jgi:hypothetical protein